MKTLLVIALLLTDHLHASVSKGKEIFLQECRSCHLEGKYFASHKKAKEWSRLLKEDALNKIHQDKNISLPYLSHEKFLEDKKHLKALLQKYSKDRGKHNSCY